MGERVEVPVVNLLTDESPRRPTKRIRPERIEKHVFSLVDTDDEDLPLNTGSKDAAAQATQRDTVHPRMMTHWGALDDQHAGAHGGAGERPIYRPPSARFRQLPSANQPKPSTAPSPIVIDDDEEEGSPLSATRRTLLRRLSDLVRQRSSGLEGSANGQDGSAPLHADRTTAIAGVPGAAAARNQGRATAIAKTNKDPAADLLQPPQQQLLQPPQQAQQGAAQQVGDGLQMLPPPARPRRQAMNLAMARRMRLAVAFDDSTDGDGGGGGDAEASSAPATASSSPRARSQPPLLFRVDRPFPQQQEQPQQFQNNRMVQHRLLAQQLPPPLDRLDRMGPLQRQESQRWAAGEGAEVDQEEEDLRLAARLQAEESDRLARETAQRMANEDHSRLMSRLNALEAAEEATRARRTGTAAAAGRRGGRNEARLPAAGPLGDADPERELGGLWGLPGYMRAVGNPASLVARGARGGAATGAAAADVDAPADGPEAAAAGGGGRGRGPERWSSRAMQAMQAVQEMQMAMALPFGLQGIFLGPEGGARAAGGENDGPGGAAAYQALRRSRNALREHMTAMREQMVAAQRAGIPANLLFSDRDFTPEDYEMLCRLDERVENRKGAKDEQLAELPTEVVGAAGRRGSDGSAATCTICMEELAPGDVMKRMPCTHDFHSGCLDPWLKTKACCPICQRGLEG